MKLPFDLGVKLFFRLLLPGFLLMLGLAPVILALVDAVGVRQHDTVFVIGMIVFGWLVVAADAPIYMLFEGRRYWPKRLWRHGLGKEETRLKNLNTAIDDYYSAKDPGPELRRRYLEASVEGRSFPVNEEGDWYAEFPTRLGNVLTAFETYSKSRYDLEAVFFWPRIWINLGKDLREELDSQQAVADSGVYAAFSLAVSGVLWTIYFLAGLLEPAVAAGLYAVGILKAPLGEGVFSFLPGPGLSLLVAIVLIALSNGAYRVAVFSSEAYGVMFMSVIDCHAKKISREYMDIDGIVERMSALTGEHVGEDEKLEIARRYLQYYTVKLPGKRRAVRVPQARKV